MKRFLPAAFAALGLLASGCSRNPLLGKWSVADIDGTVGAITHVPDGLGRELTLEAFRAQFKDRFSGKQIEFTKDESLLAGYEGTVRGCIHGAWVRDPEDKQVVNVYQWVSGPVYDLWGRATLKDGKLQIKMVMYGMVTYGDSSPVLNFE